MLTNIDYMSNFYKLEDIFFDLNYSDESEKTDSPRTVFRLSEGNNLHMHIAATHLATSKTPSKYELITVNIFDTLYNLVASQDVIINFIEQGESNKTSCVFKDINLREHTYSVEISADEESFYKDLCMVDLPENYTDCFRYDAFIMSRLRNDQIFADVVNTPTQNSFDIKNLEGIVVGSCFTNKLKKEWDYELITTLYSPLGQVIDTDCSTGRVGFKRSAGDADYNPGDLCKEFGVNTIFGRDKTNYWSRGTYRIEVDFLDEQLIVTSFDVCDKDVTALFSKDAIQPKKNIAGKKFIKPASSSTTSALSTLNEMVGLASIKEQVELFSAQIEFGRLRQEQGLTTRQAPLHAAFVGNPGTGKTTVAELIGSIFKEIGVLSSGHVVCEERSTLVGPLYSDELQLVQKAISKAKGGILFIDEAYNLHVENDPKDPGHRILESLLTSLSDEKQRDWMLILAGYPAEIRRMLDSNVGLASRVPNIYHFKDYSQQELLQIAELYLKRNQYSFTPDASKAFEMIVRRTHSMKDEQFGNARFITNILEKEIIPAMATRIVRSDGKKDIYALTTIEKCDVPATAEFADYESAICKLNKMVGLSSLKNNIEKHLNYVKFINTRRDNGIYTSTPPLHMIFMGNPGTGKTTVADYLGEIYSALGLISGGQVIKANRASLIGTHIGDTEKKVTQILKLARGNILFIDEAYTLYDNSNNKNDFGARAMEVLLDTLSKEDIDMIVILAGYPNEMKKLLSENIGLESRFPYTFHFEDYTPEELMQIAENVAEQNNVRFSDSAREAIRAIIKRGYKQKDANFGNARFVVRLITTEVIPNMSSRLSTLPQDMLSKEALQTIELSDIPINIDDIREINSNSFNERSIAETLSQLNQLVGLNNVKKAINDFVKVMRHLNTKNGELSDISLKWTFLGNSGTGKSTIAQIMASLLKAMHLLSKDKVVELRAENIYSTNSFKADELVKEAMQQAQQGLLFIDGDAPQFKNPNSQYDKNFLRMCISSNIAKMPGTCAVIIAQHESPRQFLIESLAKSGVTTLDQTFIFDDYTKDELIMILTNQLKSHNLRFNDKSKEIITNYIDSLYSNTSLGFANARTMKIVADAIEQIVILRESETTPTTPGEIIADDLNAFTTLKPIKRKLGY